MDELLKTTLKEEILNHIDKIGSMTYLEISELPGGEGDTIVGFREQNIIAWGGVSEEAATACHELEHVDKKIVRERVDRIIYTLIGSMPELPVAASQYDFYETPHWLPSILVAAPHSQEEPDG